MGMNSRYLPLAPRAPSFKRDSNEEEDEGEDNNEEEKDLNSEIEWLVRIKLLSSFIFDG